MGQQLLNFYEAENTYRVERLFTLAKLKKWSKLSEIELSEEITWLSLSGKLPTVLTFSTTKKEFITVNEQKYRDVTLKELKKYIEVAMLIKEEWKVQKIENVRLRRTVLDLREEAAALVFKRASIRKRYISASEFNLMLKEGRTSLTYQDKQESNLKVMQELSETTSKCWEKYRELWETNSKRKSLFQLKQNHTFEI